MKLHFPGYKSVLNIKDTCWLLHPGYVNLYHKMFKIPFIVAYKFNHELSDGVKRRNAWTEDKNLPPPARATNRDYANQKQSGKYHRGHLAPAGNSNMYKALSTL